MRWQSPAGVQAGSRRARLPDSAGEDPAPAVACGDALLRTACAYLDDSTGRAPPHYRSLGRSAFLKAALSADEKLGRIASSFDFLLSVSPINTTEALEKFIADGEQVEPVFRYRPLTVDPVDALVVLDSKPVALRFVAFTVSEEGQAILRSHGLEAIASVAPSQP